METKQTVHYLAGGIALCRFDTKMPRDWLPGNTWVREPETGSDSAANCPACVAAHKERLTGSVPEDRRFYSADGSFVEMDAAEVKRRRILAAKSIAELQGELRALYANERDRLAAMAMQGLLGGEGEVIPAHVASLAHEVADAMLAARKTSKAPYVPGSDPARCWCGEIEAHGRARQFAGTAEMMHARELCARQDDPRWREVRWLCASPGCPRRAEEDEDLCLTHRMSARSAR